MAVNNGIITAPINISDPYVCMGLGKYNGWYDLTYAYANAHKKVNPYSKYKPMKYDTPSTLTETQKKTVNYGYERIPYYSTIESMIDGFMGSGASANNGENPQWEYLDTSNSWKRLNDFENYNHGSLKYIDYLPLYKIPVEMDGTLKIEFPSPSQQPLNNMQLYDLTFVNSSNGVALEGKDSYLGVCFFYGSKRKTLIVTQNETIGTAWPTQRAKFSISGFPVNGRDGCSVFLFLSSRKYNTVTEADAVASGLYMPVPWSFNTQVITDYPWKINIEFTELERQTSTAFRYRFSIENGEDIALNTSSISVDFLNNSMIPIGGQSISAKTLPKNYVTALPGGTWYASSAAVGDTIEFCRVMFSIVEGGGYIINKVVQIGEPSGLKITVTINNITVGREYVTIYLKLSSSEANGYSTGNILTELLDTAGNVIESGTSPSIDIPAMYEHSPPGFLVPITPENSSKLFKARISFTINGQKFIAVKEI